MSPPPETARNKPRQLMNGSTTAPAVDPNAMPPAIAPNSHPNGRPRSGNGKRSPTRASAIGTTPLAPSPVTSRSQISDETDQAVVVNAVSTTNAMSDPTITRPRPNRSDRGPYASVAMPYGMRYAGTVRPIRCTDVPNTSASRGSSGATMNAWKKIRNVAAESSRSRYSRGGAWN